MADIVEDGEKNIRMKIYPSTDGPFIAACDSRLVGRSLREGELRLELTEEFLGMEDVNEGVFLSYLMEAVIGNLSGEIVVKIAIKAGLVDEDNVLYIEGIPHAQFVRML